MNLIFVQFSSEFEKNLPSGGEESGCSSEKGLPKVKLILQGRLPQKTGKCGNFFQVGEKKLHAQSIEKVQVRLSIGEIICKDRRNVMRGKE